MRDPSPAVAVSGSAKPRPDAKLETLMRQILGEPGELAQAAELAFGRGRPKLLDHLAHLHVLLQHLVDLLDRGAAATSDALAALAVDEGMIFTLGSVIELMMASTRLSLPSSTCASLGRLAS